jgi:hypothetical protein
MEISSAPEKDANAIDNEAHFSVWRETADVLDQI